MKSLKFCSKVVLLCLFFVSFAFAKDARSEMVSGTLEKLIVEGRPDSFYLNTGERRIPFHPPPNIRLPSGSKMSVEGDWVGGKFVGKELKRLDYDDDWTTPPNITKGNVRTAILMSYTPDKPPPSDATREAVDYEAFDNPDTSLNAFFGEASLDQNGNPQIWFTGDTFGWYVLPHNSYEYEGNYDGIMEDTIKVADPYVDFSKYDTVIIVTWDLFGSSAAYTYKIRFNTNDGIVWLSEAFLNYDIFFIDDIKQHEIGHTLGWWHGAGSFLPNQDERCACEISELKLSINDESVCGVATYRDKDVMGEGHFYHPSGWRKKHASWLKPEQCLEVRENMTFWLDQKELPSNGFKLSEIPTGLNGSGLPTSFSIELFSNVGKFDQYSWQGKNTFLVLRYHAGDYNNIGTNDSVMFVATDYQLPIFFDRDTYCNQEFGFQINFLGYSGSGTDLKAQVEVIFNCPGKVVPTVSLDVQPKKVDAGESVKFNVSVQNNGVVGCGTQTCALSITKPWQSDLGQVVETGAYQTTNTGFQVIVPADTLPGTYEMELSATDIDEQTIVGMATDTITIKARPIPTPTPSPTSKPSPTPKPTPSPSPTPIPTPQLCEADDINCDPKSLSLEKKESKDVEVTVIGSDGCLIEGATVSAKVLKDNKKRKLIKVSPSKMTTDENGQAVFTITAKKKQTKNARIQFKTLDKYGNNLYTYVKVQVK